MKNTFRFLLGSGCLVLASACYTWQPPPPTKTGASLDNAPGSGSRYWNGSTDSQSSVNDQAPVSSDPAAIAAPNTTIPTSDPSADPPPGPSDTSVPPAPSTPPPVSPPSSPSTPPYGIKVAAKPGFVYSPYDKTAGIVDVQGMAPGTKVRCPYTGKIFIVP